MPIKGCLRRAASQRAPPRQCVADDEKLETAKGYNEPSILDCDLLNIDSRQEAKQIFVSQLLFQPATPVFPPHSLFLYVPCPSWIPSNSAN